MAKKGKVNKIQFIESDIRPLRPRRYEYLFLIVCEDQKTEPAYFNQFKVQIPEKTIYLKTVGTGRDPKGVVEASLLEKEKLEIQARMEVDKVWVVFDKDDADENATKIQKFEDAFAIAERNKLQIAFSNEVFELWFLLHLTDVDSTVALPRKTIYDLLQEKIRKNKNFTNFEYQHGNVNIVEIISKIGNQNKAIQRSEKLLQSQMHKKPIEANPSTKVHIFVKTLIDLVAWYSVKI